MKQNSSKLIWLLSFVLVFMISCGSDSDSDTSTDDSGSDSENIDMTKVKGIAATGSPVVGIVYLKDADGITLKQVIGDDGSYSFDISELTPPFLLMAEGNASGWALNLFSYGPKGGIINISGATNIIMSLALDGDGRNQLVIDDIKTDENSLSGIPTEEDFNTAKDLIKSKLSGMLGAVGVNSSFDPVSTIFSANGSGFDRLMDNVEMRSIKATDDIQIAMKLDGEIIYRQNAATGIVEIDNTVPTKAEGDPIEESLAVQEEITGLMESLEDVYIYLDGVYDTDDNSATCNDIVILEVRTRFQAITPEDNSYMTMGRLVDDDAGDANDNNYGDYWSQPKRLSCEYDSGNRLVGVSIIGPMTSQSVPGGDYIIDGVTYTVEGTVLDDTDGRDGVWCEVTWSNDNQGFQYSTVESFIEETDGSWKWYGQRTPGNNAEKISTVARKYDNSDGSSELATGYDFFPGLSPGVPYERSNINSILITGEGINAVYSADGTETNGLFTYVENPENSWYSSFENSDSSWTHHSDGIYYTDTDGLNPGEIEKLTYTCIGFNLDDTTNTLTPKRVWQAYADDSKPIEVTVDNFPSLTSPDYFDVTTFRAAIDGPESINTVWQLPFPEFNNFNYIIMNPYMGNQQSPDSNFYRGEGLTAEEKLTLSSHNFDLSYISDSSTCNGALIRLGIEDPEGREFVNLREINE